MRKDKHTMNGFTHFDHEGNQNIYEVQYLKDEVEKMLKHFAKQQKLEAQKKKYERVIY